MGRKAKLNKIQYLSVTRFSSFVFQYPRENIPSREVYIRSELLTPVLRRRTQTERRNVIPFQRSLTKKKKKELYTIFYSGDGNNAIYTQDVTVLVKMEDFSDYIKDYSEELLMLVEHQIPELIFITLVRNWTQSWIPKIYNVIRLQNKQERAQKLRELKIQILSKCSPVIQELFISEYSGYNLYSNQWIE